MFDKEQREQQSDYFISNKIKRCRQCRNELDYMEKFHFTDRICCKCKGIKSFMSDEVESTQIDSDEQVQLSDARTSELYSEWLRLNKLAEKKWHSENQPDVLIMTQPKHDKKDAESVPSERIFEMIEQYDNGEFVAITQEELVSIFWEILQRRKIIA
ncbi:hypothetical protein [Pantoea sp. y20]